MPLFRKRECGRDYPKDTVILHQFPRGPYAPSMSGFCLKLETFLRMAKIPYQNVLSYKTGPKGKLPYIEYNGRTMADSQMIMSYLSEEFSVNINPSLSPLQKATGHAIQKMVDEHTYWLVILERWVFHRGEVHAANLTKLPSIVVWEIGRRSKNYAHAQGLGRHTHEEVDRLLEEDIVAISDLLDDKAFMLGDEPTEVDCAVFGQICQLRWHTPPSVKPRHVLEDSLSNVNAYIDRMKERFWSDWDDCITQGFSKEATK